jgi:hypothetical protein
MLKLTLMSHPHPPPPPLILKILDMYEGHNPISSEHRAMLEENFKSQQRPISTGKIREYVKTNHIYALYNYVDHIYYMINSQ